MALIYLVLIGLLQGQVSTEISGKIPELNPRILEPPSGSFLSGKTRLKFACNDPEKVARMKVIRNDEVVFDQDHWQSELTLDFGDLIVSWRIALEVQDKTGRVFRSETLVTRPLKVDYQETTRIILVPILAVDRNHHHITGLKQDDFEVFEDGKPCRIRLLSRQKVPLNITLLVDSSSSLKQEERILKDSVLDFITQVEGQDRCSLIIFNNEPISVFDFGARLDDIKNLVEAIEPVGATAMFDGLLMAGEQLRLLPRSRKAIVLFTDGRDSVYEEVRDKRRMLRKVIEVTQNNEISIFTIGLGEKIHKAALEFMADETGGRFVWAKTSQDLKPRFSEVLSDLKNQYILHVEPNSDAKGFHRLEVKVHKWGARVHARKGFVIE